MTRTGSMHCAPLMAPTALLPGAAAAVLDRCNPVITKINAALCVNAEDEVNGAYEEWQQEGMSCMRRPTRVVNSCLFSPLKSRGMSGGEHRQLITPTSPAYAS